MSSFTTKKRIALLHGAGYAGAELIEILAHHPHAELLAVTSRTFAGQPVWAAHPHLKGQSALIFSTNDSLVYEQFDAVLIAAEHGQSLKAVSWLLEENYAGAIVDLSTDFRFSDIQVYKDWFGYTHPHPNLLEQFQYGMVEVHAPYPKAQQYIANPGCFATGTTLALWPIAQHLDTVTAHVTALTGASGSGARPKPTTHFPTRDGNVRAYKVLGHQHQPEILQTIGTHVDLQFVPVSGPWTRGIWGTIHVPLSKSFSLDDVSQWYQHAYRDKPLIRLWPGTLPELRVAVRTPFCDIGWMIKQNHLVVGFAIDNLLKGAASHAIQNLNLVLGMHETAGLLPASPDTPVRIIPTSV